MCEPDVVGKGGIREVEDASDDDLLPDFVSPNYLALVVRSRADGCSGRDAPSWRLLTRVVLTVFARPARPQFIPPW